MNFADKARILGQLWIEFREDEDFGEFMDYNDIGVPLGYFIASGLIKETSPTGDEAIKESLEMFLGVLEVTEEEVDQLVGDGLLDSLDLASILTFAHHKKNSMSSPDESSGDSNMYKCDECGEVTTHIENEVDDKFPANTKPGSTCSACSFTTEPFCGTCFEDLFEGEGHDCQPDKYVFHSFSEFVVKA